jgi:hypothetical protein
MTNNKDNNENLGSEDPKIFSQADLDRIIGERLARDRKERAEESSAIDALKKELADTKATLLANDLEKIKARIAQDAKPPDGLLGFVQGTDEDSIRRSVDALITGLGPGPNVGGSTNPAGGNASPKVYTKAELESMSPDAINQDWTNIQKQLASGLVK